jgi:hypothetical protein
MAMTQPADLDAGLARHQRTAIKDRVAGLNQPRVGADFFHALRHIQHQAELVISPKMIGDMVVAVLFRGAIAHLGFDDVTQNVRGVDDEINALQRRLPARRLEKGQLGADLLGIPRTELVESRPSILRQYP